MEAELRSHIQHRADDLERGGLPRAEAERRARLEFGGQTRFKEESLEAAGGAFLDSLPATSPTPSACCANLPALRR